MKTLGILLLTLIPCSAASINFDNLSTSGGAVSLTNQYLASGVVFQDIYAAQNFPFNIVPPSAPNYASPFWVDTNPGYMEFVVPGNAGVNDFATTVSFTLVGLTTSTQHPGFFSGASVDALDLMGNVIPGQTVVIPAASTSTSNQILTFTGQVHELRFTHTDGTNGALPIDNLSFTLAPEPASFGLLGIGLLAAAAVRRRC
jgi:hypothetical protein